MTDQLICLQCQKNGLILPGAVPAKVTSRGLCAQHYNACRHLVNDGLTTWEELEQLGACAPAARGGAFGKGNFQTHIFSPDELERRRAARRLDGASKRESGTNSTETLL